MKQIFTLILLTFSLFNSKAQEAENEYKYWMTLGFGGYDQTVSVNLNYSFSIGDNFYKVDYLYRGGALGGVGGDGLQNTSIDISIGKRIQSEWIQASLFCGPSYLYGRKSIGSGDSEFFHTFGLQTYLQVLFRPANELGIGFGLFGNLNFVKNYVGININLTVGNGK